MLPAWLGPVLHSGRPPFGPATVAVLTLAGLGSAVLVGLALAAFARRRSRSYLLVTLALATVLARTAVSAATLAGGLPEPFHHLVEHGLDALMAALVVGAVYYARTVEADSVDGAPTGRTAPDGGGPAADDEPGDEGAADRHRDGQGRLP